MLHATAQQYVPGSLRPLVPTMKFCCSGDQEYMTGTEATALRVFRGMTCRGNSEKPLSTVHCAERKNLRCQNLFYSFPRRRPFLGRSSTDLSRASQGADGRHDVNRLDSPRLPLLVQNVSSVHDFLTVGVEHALDRERKYIQRKEKEPETSQPQRGAILTAAKERRSD